MSLSHGRAGLLHQIQVDTLQIAVSSIYCLVQRRGEPTTQGRGRMNRLDTSQIGWPISRNT